MKRFIFAFAVATATLVGTGGIAGAGQSGPTCSDVVGLSVEVHGQHVVRDYVLGPGSTLDWPPTGISDKVRAERGAALPGGPGPSFHFEHGVAPGASFCTDSRSGDRP